jgi:hypothetical protein
VGMEYGTEQNHTTSAIQQQGWDATVIDPP